MLVANTTAAGRACVRLASSVLIFGCRGSRITSSPTSTAQRVARIINEPTILLDHVVGAGKTARW